MKVSHACMHTHQLCRALCELLVFHSMPEKLPCFIHKVHVSKANQQHCKHGLVVTRVRDVLVQLDQRSGKHCCRQNQRKTHLQIWRSQMTLPYKTKVAHPAVLSKLSVATTNRELPAFLHLLASLTFVTSDTWLFFFAAQVLIFW